MDSPDGLPPRKRKRIFPQQQRPTSRRNSSSSSEILVAAPSTSSPRTALATEEKLTTMGAFVSAPKPQRRAVTARVEDGYHLIVSFNDAQSRASFKNIIEASSGAAEEDAATGLDHASTLNDDDDGPNARGTYSKAYVAKHPEIGWVHRGQGRYIPLTQARGAATNTPAVERTTRTRISRQSSTKDGIKVQDGSADEAPDWTQQTTRRRGPARNLKVPDSQPPTTAVLSGRPSLRNTKSLGNEPLRSPLTTRSGRNAKPEPEADSPERRSSRFSSRRTYNEQDSADSDDDMAGDKDQTYDRDYVNEHPTELFYHTGNGWYKRGQRPRGSKAPKKRESTGHASARLSEGTYNFDGKQTIHSTQLHLYPNIEFHHCGNGWYKPGPDATGHRNSTVFEASASEGRSSLEVDEEEGEDDEGGDEEELPQDLPDTTVDREHVNKHPEIEWVHRGNGRYRAKYAHASLPEPDSSAEDIQAESRGDAKTYSRAYVDAHPNEVFHHRGNARYMRGPPPAHWAEARKQRRQSGVIEALAPANMTAVDDGTLYDKAWVESHPHEEYHHRGQGRYARGPRQPRASLPQSTIEEPEYSDGDPDELVDTKYVKDHPYETFHHRGQGRWARGLPPLGASNKIAVKGPGAESIRPSESASQAEEEEPQEKPPGLTELVVKGDGPIKWPHLAWVYRGGGKWCRRTKQEVEDMQKGRTGRKVKGRARKGVDGAAAQLERETADAVTDGYHVDDEAFGISGDGPSHMASKPRPPPIRRRRTNNTTATRDSFNHMDEDMLLSKQSSQKSVSQAPTPKPRIMTEEEDVLTEEDLPQLYRDEWSPPTEELDEADILLRERFRPMNGPEVFLKGMTKHEPNTRPTANLLALAENADIALQQLAAEFIELDKITAPHRRVPGKPAKGGTVPTDPLTWEDKKEADLYDYTFDPRKVGEQDPDAQRIQRDAEGRELRGRRNRSAFHNTGTVPGWNFGEDQPLGPRRAVKAPQRFDGVVAPPRKRARNSTTATRGTSQAPSLTPERGMTPMTEPTTLPLAAGKGRWVGHVPKRVQELRGDSMSASVGPAGEVRSKEGSPARKGRPPGSKNLHKRKDAGIKKGPRKPKVQEGGVVEGDAGGEGAAAARSTPGRETEDEDRDAVEEEVGAVEKF